MPHQPYPNLDVECVTTIIDIGRRGAIREEIRDFAKCSYNFLGAVLKVTVGEPADVIVGSSAENSDEPTAEQLEECYGYIAAAQSELEAYASEPGVAAIDPAMLALLVQIAQMALAFFINRK